MRLQLPEHDSASGPPRFHGRVIRVPVANAQGAGEASRVHARLNFLPDDRDGSFSPRDPAQGEWSDEGAAETEIDLPGNGRARMLDVAVALDGPYPNVHEWTRRSRAAWLMGYAIKSTRVDVEIQVMGTRGETLRDSLRIECRANHMLIANWISAGPDEATNWVAWD